MRHVWGYSKDGCLAAEVHQALDLERPLALTTVLTTLDRLYDKGIVRREREGKAYRYRAVVTELELEQRIVEGVINNLIAQFPKAVATYFSQAENEDASLSDLAWRIAQIQGDSPVSEELEEGDA